ncbi:MAG: succinate dehydrogenase [Terriglobales bacterium]
MSTIDVPLERVSQRGFGETQRNDFWWVTPLVVFLGLGAFVCYSTWAAFQGDFFRFGPYLSPMYSPQLLNVRPDWWPFWIPFSASLIILWAPGGFRLTCYYYRGAYYKAFWADPSTCAVGEPRKKYWGERKFPLLLQNAHRYFFYIALIFLVILFADAWNALWWTVNGHTEFQLRIGTLIMIADPILLAGYTFGCHSLRHLIGGCKDEIGSGRRKAYNCVSCLNGVHMRWAWASLIVVAFTDIYIRLCAMGIWHDLVIWRPGH